ncbi:MAG: hypothetical protein CMD25_04135 [Flavobacteriales bacterium]|nr:hypothetical protein [Flavobacteriales bacterium]
MKLVAPPPPAPTPVTPENIKEFPSADTTTDCPALPKDPGVSPKPIKVSWLLKKFDRSPTVVALLVPLGE